MNNFESKVRSGGYDLPEKPWLSPDFWPDFYQWLEDEGVPKKYSAKVASVAWSNGHASGLYDVLNCSYDLIDIFKEN